MQMRHHCRICAWLYNNGLSVLFFALFVAALAVQSISGLVGYNEHLSVHSLPPIGYLDYLSTGDFLDGVFTNWQAAILQLAALIIFGGALHQKGASHSRRPEGDSSEKRRAEGAGETWVYRHSLSMAFTLYFMGSFTAHVIFGSWSYNEARALAGQPPVQVGDYLLTGTFWNKTCQTWEAEFFAIGLFLVSSIFLREQASVVSKPVRSANQDTGETNK